MKVTKTQFSIHTCETKNIIFPTFCFFIYYIENKCCIEDTVIYVKK